MLESFESEAVASGCVNDFGPVLATVGGDVVGLVDDGDGVAHIDGVASVFPPEDGCGSAAQGCEVAFEEDGPDGASTELAETGFAWVAYVFVIAGGLVDDTEDFVAPRFVAGCHEVVESFPSGGFVVDDDGADAVAKTLTNEAADGKSSVLT